jgi:peptidoglycan/LPS O-acetylase OafA/YrhL
MLAQENAVDLGPQSKPLTLQRGALPALMGVRFLAAFYVVLFHGEPWLAQHVRVPHFVQTFLSNGYLAVGLFFLLSGFILAYTYEGQISGAANRLRFWEARFARIYPVYFLSLLLAWWFERTLTLGTRIAVFTMVQAWNPREPQMAGAWNYPAWTLSVEAFFYLLFPFVQPRISRRSNGFLSWTVAVLLAVCVWFHTPVISLGNWNHSSFIGSIVPLPLLRIPEFLLGMVMGTKFLRARDKEASANQSRPLRVYIALFMSFMLLSLPLGEWVSFVILPFAMLIYELALGGSLVARVLSHRLMVLLGGASYAVYLLQFPVRNWTRVLFVQFPHALARFCAPLTPLVLVLFSILVFRFWEEPARKQLRSWFAAGRSRASAVLVPDAAGKDS